MSPKVTGEWTIHFAANEFLVTDFLEEISEAGGTIEQSRVELEKHITQFSAARTKWDVYNESKRLISNTFAESKRGRSQL